MNLNNAKTLALSLMAQHKLIKDFWLEPAGHSWTLRWTQSKRIFGTCCHREHVIEISKPLTELNLEADVKDTVLHEIAHALLGPGHGHGEEWKLLAMSIGAKPQRCYDSERVKMPLGKYQAVCKSCGNTKNRFRKPKKAWLHACRTCCERHAGGKFDLRFVLRYKQVR
jgi:predicted SprT family Zn-dependent metalloprotease